MAIDSSEKRRAILNFGFPVQFVEGQIDGSIGNGDRFLRLGLYGEFSTTLRQNFGEPFISLANRLKDDISKMANFPSVIISRSLR